MDILMRQLALHQGVMDTLILMDTLTPSKLALAKVRSPEAYTLNPTP